MIELKLVRLCTLLSEDLLLSLVHFVPNRLSTFVLFDILHCSFLTLFFDSVGTTLRS